MKLTKEFIIWCAGFFDGEGSISIKHIKTSGQYALEVRIVQNIEEVIQKIASAFNGKVYRDKDYPKLNAKRPIWRVLFANKKGEIFLKIIYPYLLVKRKQTEIALNFQKLLDDSPNTKEKIELKQKFKEQIMQLNAATQWVA